MIKQALVMSDGAVKPLLAVLRCNDCGHTQGIYNPDDMRLTKPARLRRWLGTGGTDCPNVNGAFATCKSTRPMHLARHRA